MNHLALLYAALVTLALAFLFLAMAGALHHTWALATTALCGAALAVQHYAWRRK